MSRKSREWKEIQKKYFNKPVIDPATGIVYRFKSWVRKPTLANYRKAQRIYQKNIKAEKKRKGYIIGVYKGEYVADIDEPLFRRREGGNH